MRAFTSGFASGEGELITVRDSRRQMRQMQVAHEMQNQLLMTCPTCAFLGCLNSTATEDSLGEVPEIPRSRVGGT